MTFGLPKRVAENITKFSGRTWLLPPLLEWFERTTNRLFILQGKPGTGKSMISAWLMGEGPEPTDAGSISQLRQIRLNVKAGHFCVEASGSSAPKAFAQNIAEQLTRNVEGFGEALATTLADQVKISGIVNVDKQIDAGGSATGVYIERLDLGALSDELSFDRLFRGPLKKLYESGYKEPMMLLVDALDEAETYTGSTTIVRLLARLTDLPNPIRLLITTRPDPRVLKHYRDVTPFDLIEDAPDDENDVRLYAYERLAELDNKRRNYLSGRIAQAAEGNFLYAHLILDDISHRLPDIVDLDAIALPNGLSGLYHEFLNRELGFDEECWYLEFKPVLGLIAVAQGDGLRRAQIESIIGKEVEKSLRICMQYLDGDLPEGPFRLFHKSFADFLLEANENKDYHIDAASMHRQLTAHCLTRYGDNWSNCDKYCLLHMPEHLIGAGDTEELEMLLSDFNWLENRLNATDVSTLISDYDLLPGNADLGFVRGAIKLSGHVLDKDKVQLAGQLLGRLLSETAPKILRLLEQAKRYRATPWLRPLRSSLTPPGGPLSMTLEGVG